jgi:hypothetical protein
MNEILQMHQRDCTGWNLGWNKMLKAFQVKRLREVS